MSSTSNRRNYLSAALVAVSLLFALDAGFSLTRSPNKEDKFQLDRCDILNVVKAYQSEPRTPDVALLGSSLIEVPSIEAAAIAVNKPVERLTHHRCDYLEKELATRIGRKPAVVSLAVGGEMASDAYLIAKHLLADDRAPRAIIYGIGPRDFQDNLMPGIDSSETFKLLSSIEDIPDFWQAQQLSPESKLALTIENLSGLCGNRNQLASLTTQVLTDAIAPLFPAMKRSLTPEPVKTDVNKFIAGLVHPGKAVWHPDDEYMIQNYLARYNPVAPRQVTTQFGYLNRLLRLCKERKTPIMVVNMPLGEMNQRVMPPGLYSNYLTQTQKLCCEQGVPYIDLNVAPLNARENFLDTVHLNPTGSAQLFSMMSQAVDPSIASALSKDENAIAGKPTQIF